MVHMEIEEHHCAGKDVRAAYLPGMIFVANRRNITHETLVSDLEYADDMALVASSWDNLKSMLDS